jgi:TonB family protein
MTMKGSFFACLLLLPGLAAAQVPSSGSAPPAEAATAPPPSDSACKRLPYPPGAARLGYAGATTLSFTVTTDGSVKDPVVAQSSGHAELDEAAIAHIHCVHYKPAMRNGKPAEVPWTVTINWRR